MEDNNPRKIYGVLGYPAKHSLSPLMHNAAFDTLGIDAEYKIFEKSPVELDEFLRLLSQNNIFGLNVTVPYKEKVLPFLSSISSEAELIGAVNTIKVSDKKLEGFNTDGEGFYKHLTEDLKFDPRDKSVALIGAGGAARAVSVYLGRGKPKLISIYDKDQAKAGELVLHLKKHFGDAGFMLANSIKEMNIKSCNLLVNATPVGLKIGDGSAVDKEFIHRELLVYDLIYAPKETELLKVAAEKGARTSNGIGMLLYQGMLSFEIWTGKPAPKEVMQRALFSAIEGR